MTVAVSCNLSDGVILGADSAASVPTPGGIAKVYENAEKLFQLSDRPIGVTVYGLGALGMRSIGSYLREFEVSNPDGIVTDNNNVADIVEALRTFFMNSYRNEVIIPVETATGRRFEDIPIDQWPILGLVVGGFSHNAYLSEIWNILIPEHGTPQSAQCTRAQGDFGSNWFAMPEPIRRYIKGFDPSLIEALSSYFLQLRGGAPFSPQEEQQMHTILGQYEYQVPFAAMPMQEGIAYTRFLVELVINHHRFSLGPPVVGGRIHIGAVTYRGERFQILES